MNNNEHESSFKQAFADEVTKELKERNLPRTPDNIQMISVEILEVLKANGSLKSYHITEAGEIKIQVY